MKVNYKQIAAAGWIFCILPMLSFAEPLRSAAEPDYPPLSIVNPDGQADGFSVELLRATLNEMGREVVFETGLWAEIKSALAEGSLDVLPLVGRTPEREAIYDFTIPYLTLHGALFIRNDNTQIHGLSDLPGQRIAVMKGDNAEEYVRRTRLSDRIVTTSNFDEAFRMLSAGRADAVIAQKLMGVSLLKELSLKNIQVRGKPNEEFKQDFCFAVKKGNAELLSVLNEGLAVIKAKGLQRQIFHKWMGDSEQDALRARIIIYGGDWAYPPYEFLDDKGRPSGFNIDLARAIAVEMGVEISFHLEARSEIRQKMDVGEIDMASMTYSPDRASQFQYALPHAVLYRTVFSRMDSPPYKTLEDLKNRRVAVQGGDILHEFALAQGLEKTLTVTAFTEEALSLLARGKVDFALGNHTPGLYWIHENGWKNLRAVDSIGSAQEYCFVVQNDNKALLDLFNEGLQRLKATGEYRQIYNKWMKVLDPELSRKMVLKWLLIALAIATLLVAFVTTIILVLKRQVNKRTAQLQKSNLALKESHFAALNMMEDAVAAKDQMEHLQVGLKESELKYRTLADSGQALIWTSGVDKLCNYFNQTWLDFTGRSLEQELGDGWTEGLYPEDFDDCVQTYVTAFDQHKPFSMEYRMRHISGEYRWIQDDGTPRFDEKGSFLGYIGHCLDITDRKEVEEKIIEQKKLTDKYLRVVGVMLGVLDASGDIVLMNAKGLEIFGYSSDRELLGKNWFDLCLPPEQKNETQDVFNRLMSGDLETDEYFENLVLTRTGEQRLIAFHNSILRDRDGRISGMLFSGEDITGQRLLETQFRQSQKMDAIGRLAGGVAHDFNNKLQVILGYTEMAIQKTEVSDPLYEDLLEVQKAAKQSSDLTRHLLAFARKQTITPKRIDLNATVEEMFKMLRRLIGENINLRWEPGANLWPIMMDPSQIDQILANLSVNARDALEGTGTVTIVTSNITLDQAGCCIHPDCIPGDYVRLSFSDTGCGMEQDVLDHIFEPFFTTKKAGEGTGLGLAIVYGIVKQNNGFTTVYSTPTIGTTFTIYLPRDTGKEVADEKAVEKKPPERGHETILLVEDEAVLLKLEQQILEELGYTVLAAALPNEALRLAEEHSDEIDLLLTDVIMPGMNGQALAAELTKFRPDLKCIFMSGYTADVIARNNVLAEGVQFIQKPFSTHDLARKLRDVLDA